MATLKNVKTEQAVDVEDADHFLANVENAADWIVVEALGKDSFGNPILPPAESGSDNL